MIPVPKYAMEVPKHKKVKINHFNQNICLEMNIRSLGVQVEEV